MSEPRRVKVVEASGRVLDYLVAKALGWTDYPEDSAGGDRWWFLEGSPFGPRVSKDGWRPTENWNQGGPLMTHHSVWPSATEWGGLQHAYVARRATCRRIEGAEAYGPDVLTAVCRTLVVSLLGEEVELGRGAPRVALLYNSKSAEAQVF